MTRIIAAPPRMGVVYTASQVFALDLLDSPSFGFWVDGHQAVIQTAHTSIEELLSVPGFAATKWRYLRTTHEWIPVFQAVDNGAVIACMDIEPSIHPFDEPGTFWVTPKGLPREQYVWSDA